MAQVFKLFRLQQLDSTLDKINKRLGAINLTLSDDKRVKQANSHLAQEQARYNDAVKQLRQAEEVVRSQKLKIEYNQTNLYSGRIQNPKELQDLQQESVALNKQLSILEDHQLEIMISVEEIDTDVKKAQANLDTAQKQSAEQNALLLAEQAQLLRDQEIATAERNTVAATISADELSIYETLRTKRGGIAVAQVQNKACSACGTTLSATLMHDARNPGSLTYCDTCSRILYAG